jgi:hypothetical protein
MVGHPQTAVKKRCDNDLRGLYKGPERAKCHEL